MEIYRMFKCVPSYMHVSYKKKNKYNTVKSDYPRPILYAVDVELHGDVKAVEEISPKHKSVLRGVYGMDPTCTTHKSCQNCRGGKG